MKILVLSPLYYPDRFGGIEKVAYEITRRLEATGVDTTVICGTLSAGDTFSHEGVTVHRVCSVGAFNDGSFEKYYEANNKALEFIRKEKPDVIWAHDWFFSLAALNYAETHTVTLIGQAHILKRVESRNRISSWRSFVDLMQSLLFRNSDLVVAATPSQFQSLHQNYRIPKNRIEILRYGLDSFDFNKTNATQPELATFIYLGRFEAEKNIERLLDSLAICENELSRPICVRLMGSGSLQKNLEERASKLSKVHIEFLPFSSDFNFVQKTISSAHALILPSLYDSYGLAALEALSMGVPVLVSRQCGISEDLNFYPRELIFNAHDKNEICDALHYCLKNFTRLADIGLDTRQRLLETHNWDLSLGRVLDSLGLARDGLNG